MYKPLGRQFARQLAANPARRRLLRSLSQAGLLPPSVWKRLPVEATFSVELLDGDSFEYASVADDSIGRALYWRGIDGWETETINLYCRLAKQSKVIVDVGANVGVYTLIACAVNQQARVYAFEPVPHIYEHLTNNVHLNQWQNRCILKDIAVSNQSGMAQFHVPHGTIPTSASLSPDGFRGTDGFLINVTVDTLDNVCHNEFIDLVKIDVEGFEDAVLLGMRGILQRSSPNIIVECNFDGPFREIERILSEYSYSFFHLRTEGPQPTTHIQPDPAGRYRNYLCLAPHTIL